MAHNAFGNVLHTRYIVPTKGISCSYNIKTLMMVKALGSGVLVLCCFEFLSSSAPTELIAEDTAQKLLHIHAAMTADFVVSWVCLSIPTTT